MNRRNLGRRARGRLVATALLASAPLVVGAPGSSGFSATDAAAATTTRDHRTSSSGNTTTRDHRTNSSGNTTTRDHRTNSSGNTTTRDHRTNGSSENTTTRDHRRRNGAAHDNLETGGHLDKTVTAATEREVRFAKGANTVGLVNCSAYTEPYVHILDGSGQQVAMGSPTARYASSTGGSFRAILRARDNRGSGACDLAVNGNVVERAVQVAGWKVRLTKLRKGESIQTVALAPLSVDSGEPTHVVYEMAGDSIRRRYGGAGATEKGVGFAPGAGTVYVVLATTDQSHNARLRLIRNDAGLSKHDRDGDGLGDELEASLGTCSDRKSVVKGFDCSLAADARDTDGDGISDQWEVLGRRDVAPYQALPTWGADPRHKDLFLEVDFANGCWSTSNPKPTDLRMPAAAARDMAKFYGDEMGSPSSSQRARRAKQLRNPDGRPGIRLHIDSGRAPEKREDITVFGDWGGFGEVPAQMDANSSCTGFANGASNWESSMEPARRGIFHYAAGYPGGGGAAQEFRLYSQWNMHSGLNAAHEFGHSLGIGHSGPSHRLPGDPNCKPNYQSIMNYAYYDHPGQAPDVGFSDGSQGAPLDNQSVAEQFAVDPADTSYLDHLENVFRYNVDRAFGHVDWNRDGEFSAVPVRAYTNYAPGGNGCEWTRYNSVGVDSPPVSLSPALASMSSRLYSFFVRSSDGKLVYVSSDSAFDCPEVGKGCNGGSFSRPTTTNLDATRGVAAARVGSDILVVTNDASGTLWASRLSRATGQDRWSAPQRLAADRAGGEPALVSDGHGWALLAYRAAQDQRIVVMPFDVQGGWGSASPAGTIDSSGTAQLLPQMSTAASPGLTYARLPEGGREPGTRNVYGLFADASGRLQVWRLDRETLLFTPVDVLQGTGPFIMGRPSGTMTHEVAPEGTLRIAPSRSFQLAYLDVFGQPRRMRTFADGAKHAAFQKTYENPTWQGARVDWCDQWAKDCGKPAADHFCRLQAGDDARSSSFKMAPDIGATIRTRTLVEGRTCAKKTCDGFSEISCVRDAFNPRDHRRNAPGPRYWVGLDGPFDNSWAVYQGITLFEEAGVDETLRAMVVTSDGAPSFRPNADGLTSIEIGDVSDWEVFSVTLCRTLMRPRDAIGGKVDETLDQPVECLDWDSPWY